MPNIYNGVPRYNGLNAPVLLIRSDRRGCAPDLVHRTDGRDRPLVSPGRLELSQYCSKYVSGGSKLRNDVSALLSKRRSLFGISTIPGTRLGLGSGLARALDAGLVPGLEAELTRELGDALVLVLAELVLGRGAAIMRKVDTGPVLELLTVTCFAFAAQVLLQ
jgi:hypothetical protein